jgi:hypothetical protein
MQRGVWRRVAATAIVLATALVAVPQGAAITLSTGEGFDTCTALPTSAMRSITTYTVANIYIGGDNMGCAQPQLTADWVSTVTGAGWRLIPTFVGKQAPCKNASGGTRISTDLATAASDGTADADIAATRMAALRLAAPNVVYDDMEAYNATDTACAAAVAAYLDAFITRLHSDGYRVGVYGSTGSTVAQLVAAYNTASRQRPDDIWIARQNGGDTTADAAVPSGDWVHRRVRQYRLNQDTVNPPSGDPLSASIDKDAVDGDTAAPSSDQPASYAVSGTASVGFVRERSTPSTSGADMLHDNEGAPLTIVCQTTGDTVAGDPIWDKLADNNYVSDLYTTTPGGLSYAGTLPRCDNTPTARITAPMSGTQVNAGATVTVQVAIPVTATSVQIQASPDNTTWHAVASASTAGNGVATLNFTPTESAHLRAVVTDGANQWFAVNTPTIEVVEPMTTMATTPAGTLAPTYTFHWTGVDGAARPTAYDVQYQRAAWNAGFGPWTSPSGWTGTTSTSKALSLAEGYEYCVRARAYGLFGNVGGWSAPRCIDRALDDRAMTAGTGWARGTASGYYNGTFTSSKTYGAALTRTGATVTRIGIVATRCATCGSVAVYVGNTHVGTISLYAPSTRLKQLLTTKTFTYRSKVTVTLRVATSGKLVVIDGLLLSRIIPTGLPTVG